MLEATISVDPSRSIGNVSPMIYGHFIEQLGRCITGGIWGEMLRARRFAGFDDDRNGLADPWRKLGGRAPHLLVEPPESITGGWLTMRCLRDTGEPHRIAHPGLSVRRGQRYTVSVELRASAGIGEVQIGLAGETLSAPAPGPDGALIEWTVRAPWDSDDAALTIGCRGEGELQLRAPSVMAARDRESDGFRADVIEMARALEPPIIRWPGGCFADGYRWRDGVGDRNDRPARFDPAWEAWDDNDVGTEEFARFCRLVGAEPYICVNTGSDDAASAADWVRFCTERDLGVRWWGVGNETYGSWEIGNLPAGEYARLFLEFAEAMRAQNPRIELVAVGADPADHPHWNPTVLEIAGGEIDHLSVHRYVPHTRDDGDRERQYRAIVAAPVEIERRLRMVAATIDEVLGEGGGVGIALDEWNVWLDANRGNLLEEKYELRDGLFAAGAFNAMHRTGDRLSMANLAQLVNVLPAIVTSPTAVWGTPLYHAFSLYRHCHGPALACECDSPTFDAEAFGNTPALAGVPWVDGSAILTGGGGEIALAVVNRHPSEEVAAKIALSQPVRGLERAVLSGAHERTANSAPLPDAVAVDRGPLDVQGTRLSVRFPPHSATVLRLRLAPTVG